MSYNRYNLDGIKTQLNKILREYRALLTAWECVTFPTKKDGTPFKVMSKNICGAHYHVEEWAMQPGEYKLRVNILCDGSGYISDSISAHNLVRHLTDATKRAKTQNYQPKQPCMEKVYTYDLDDIKEAVAARIDYFREDITKMEAQLQNADRAYAAFRDAYAAALDQLAQDAGGRSSLFYMVRDTVQTRYPYC